MIGGQGERKTLRLMAEYAEMANMTTGVDELPRKLEVLAGHCADVGRDIATINKTSLSSLFLGKTHDEAIAKVDRRLAGLGTSWAAADENLKRQLSSRFLIGDADEIGEQVQRLLEIGLDGVCVNLPADDADTNAVAFAGEVLTKALA
jgi:alkanesulfonate monooxygenase SsuD/methylene tetrahydromethanopterin reductase-like flavin-dependent oxidoreductase (luciferase family)